MYENYINQVTMQIARDVLERAGTIVPKYKGQFYQVIVRSVIEKDLLGRPLENDSDLEDACDIVTKLGFTDVPDWVTYTLRKNIEKNMNLCRKCLYYQRRTGCCVLHNYIVNPLFCDKDCFVKADRRR